MANCPVHNVPFKVIPAGFSQKTQKSYNAFEACSVQGCKEKPAGAGAPRPAPAVSVELAACLGRIEAKLDTLIAKQSVNAVPKQDEGIRIENIPF